MVHHDLKIEPDTSHAPGSGSQMKRVRGESMTVHSKRTKINDVDDASIKRGMETAVAMNLTPGHLTVGGDTGDTSVSLDHIIAHASGFWVTFTI
jgi:hypothetical protein